MNKKGVIAIIVIIVLVIIGFQMWGGDQVSVTNPGTTTGDDNGGLSRDDFAVTDKDTTDASLISRLKSASVSASESGSRVALSGGKAQFTSEGVKGTVALGDIAVEKTVAGKKYAVATLAVSSGSAQTFQYVVLFEEEGGNLADKSYSLLGDRVRITGIRADEVAGGLVVSVSYLEHDKGEAKTSAPTVPRTKILVVENGTFNAAKEINL